MTVLFEFAVFLPSFCIRYQTFCPFTLQSTFLTWHIRYQFTVVSITLTTGESESTTSMNTIVESTPHGDVFLELDRVQLRVCSQVLSIASKVWGVMFWSRFAEGQRIDQGKSLHHKLPEDYTEAITIIVRSSTIVISSTIQDQSRLSWRGWPLQVRYMTVLLQSHTGYLYV